jgi:hypothetical protein
VRFCSSKISPLAYFTTKLAWSSRSIAFQAIHINILLDLFLKAFVEDMLPKGGTDGMDIPSRKAVLEEICLAMGLDLTWQAASALFGLASLPSTS